MSGWSSGLSRNFLGHYDTLRGVVRRELVSRQLAEHLSKPPARVCDVGGGEGQQAIALARQGYEVSVLDPSEEMLQGAREALASEEKPVRDRVRLFRRTGEDAPRLFGRGAFDAVLCHGVLAYLEEPGPLIRVLADLLGPGGIVSILTKNARALAMRPGLEGRYEDALIAFDADRDRGRLGVTNRAHTVPDLSAMLEKHGVEPEQWYGVRVFTDHLDDRRPGPDLAEVLEAEWEAGRRDPYRGVARLVHLIGRRLTSG